jgi:outer membrane receptor for monomeric catechols
MVARYTVTVEADYESEWYLTPMGFATMTDALKHAAGIAKGWEGRDNTPSIWIRGAENEGPWTVKGLLAVASWYRWFDADRT